MVIMDIMVIMVIMTVKEEKGFAREFELEKIINLYKTIF